VNFFETFFSNKVIIVCLTSYIIAQLLKVIIVLVEQKKLDFGRFVGAGGMPSSHAALVVSLATSVGVLEGFQSVEFAICLILSLVVMYDASGVRRAAGEQAKILNKLVDNLYKSEKLDSDEFTKQLKELLGHTPFQVIVGAVLGIAVALLMLY